MFRNTAFDRHHLRFTEEVLTSFRFLEDEYDFCVIKAESTFVRYESPTVFINVYHGRASYELAFEIGRLDDGTGNEESPFRLGMILEHFGGEESTSLFQASTKNSVRECVPKLADLVKSYAAPFFSGDPSVYEQLMNTRIAMSERIMKHYRVTDVRKKADAAWHSRNYEELARLYKSIIEDLTPLEVKKLNYARSLLP